MSPIFAYLLALMIWIFFACLTWLAAGVMALAARTRHLSRPLCFAMAGTFPFVFVYQVVAAPFVASILLIIWAFWKMMEPGASEMTDSPLIIAVSLGGAFLSFGVMLAMSLAGFFEGWRTGWACANGRSFMEVASGQPTARLLLRLARNAIHLRSHKGSDDSISKRT